MKIKIAPYSTFVVLLCLLAQLGFAQKIERDKLASKEGFIPFLLDEEKGKIYLDVKPGQEFLYVSSLAAGVGSNDIGLDRGQLGQTRVVEFRKAGNKLLLVHKNYDFRAESNNADERKSVQDAFAESVLWGFEIAEQKGSSYLVDATNFYLQDVHQVAEKLGNARQGTYKLDNSRSALYFPMVKNFPKNTEVEATITVVGTPAGSYIRSVTPSPEAVTVRQRHSFIELPEPGYKPREFDPRGGYFGISFMDFATPIGSPITKRYISRHRLQKKDPNAAVSEPIKPIVYYLDRGAPEPIRSALLEGGNWWAQAFEAAGFKNAYRVELLPEGADPMDVRYNVIQWVHRSTRGWSYGASVRDPRTGEIIKGHVTLGSLRVRQDYLIAEGLLQPYKEGKPADKRMEEMALARLRQLSAHEIGHTLGIAHSYAASPKNKASVMDYPYPQIEMDRQGNIDLNKAYDDKIGEWDKWAIRFGYEQFPEGTDEKKALNKLLEDTYGQGYEFISDVDARSPSGSHPAAHLWDNGEDAAKELNRLMEIRRTKLQTFGLNAIQEGTPVAMLEEALVPLYMMHRYQVEAAAKLLGGVQYNYQVKGDNQPQQKVVDKNIQKRALHSLLRTLSAEELTLPENIVALMPPRPMGYSRSRETFGSRSGLNFDPVAGAEAAAITTLQFLLDPARANRMIQQHYQNAGQLGYSQMLDTLLMNTVYMKLPEKEQREVKMLVDRLVLEQLMQVAKDKSASYTVRAVAHQKLVKASRRSTWWGKHVKKSGDKVSVAHHAYLRNMLKKYRNTPLEIEVNRPVAIPDGAPIGQGELFIGCEH